MEKQDIIKKQLKTGFPFACCKGLFALCGQPEQEDLEEFKREAWTDVLNLRNERELESLNFDLPNVCQSLGLNYSHIPIVRKGCINEEALKKAHKLLYVLRWKCLDSSSR